MAMKQCEYGNMIASNAGTCPKCGKHYTSIKMVLMAIYVAVALVVLILLILSR
jgi:uncharacterized paraquat-inducible protein A